MSGLKNKRIAVTAERRASEIGTLIEKAGGHPVFTPLQGEQKMLNARRNEDIAAFLKNEFNWIVLTTGTGICSLETAASEQGRHDEFIRKLKRSRLAVRGQKAMTWLKEKRMTADVLSRDGTMQGIVEGLEGEKGELFLQAYSVDDAAWKETFEKTGARVYLSRPYEYKPPRQEVRQHLVNELVNKGIHAVLFTSKTQVRNLFEEEGGRSGIVKAMNGEVKAAATGKVTARELEKNGVETVLYPASQKMGAMVIELSRYFDATNEKGEGKNG